MQRCLSTTSWSSVLFFILLGLSFSTFAQSVKYISDVDQNLSLKTLVCAPLVDNVSGIYASALNETLINSLESNHQWETKPLDKSSTSSPEEFETSPEAVKLAVKKAGGDGLVAGRISKGPNGVSIKLTLYAGSDGLAIGSETLNNYPGFEIADLKVQLQSLVKLLRGKLPYHGIVISRKGQLVTLNIGSASGIRPGVEATVIQVIKVTRHPKFGFIISTDNLTLGKIRINKVDDFLSFGTITSERDANVIAPGNKISLGNAVQYADSNVMSEPDSPMAFGDHPKEWVPETPPSMGKIGFMVGLGNYTISNGLNSGSISGSSSATPSLHVNGELWFSPNWSMDLHLRDYVFSVTNGLSNSGPATLNASMLQTSLDATYSFLITDDFFGPKFQTGLGYSSMSTNIDNSTPTAFESTTYGGLFIKLGGSLPLGDGSEKYPYSIGARLNYFLSPTESEAPTNSGSAGNVQVNSFSVFGDKRYSERINLHGELMFDSMSTSFSGTGSRAIPSSSSSQSFLTVAFGAEFMF